MTLPYRTRIAALLAQGIRGLLGGSGLVADPSGEALATEPPLQALYGALGLLIVGLTLTPSVRARLRGGAPW